MIALASNIGCTNFIKRKSAQKLSVRGQSEHLGLYLDRRAVLFVSFFEASEESICQGWFFIQTKITKVDCVWVLIRKSSGCQARLLASSLNAVGSSRLIVNTYNAI